MSELDPVSDMTETAWNIGRRELGQQATSSFGDHMKWYLSAKRELLAQASERHGLEHGITYTETALIFGGGALSLGIVGFGDEALHFSKAIPNGVNTAVQDFLYFRWLY